MCTSDHQFDMIHLIREGVLQVHGLPAVQSNNWTFQANFILVFMIQKGNDRCYGSFRNSSHVWSSQVTRCTILSQILWIWLFGTQELPVMNKIPDLSAVKPFCF
ncbi:Killer cell immunoglobulin-like receptor 3DL1, partial [Lemmus lemmus]